VVGIENLPYKSILEPLLGNIMLDLGGTVSTKTTQEDRSVFVSNDGTKVGPIICYESVYGEYVTGYVKKGANLLCIITNDGWWDDTPGYKQHLSYAKLRAIETRRDIARSANTGMSAFINQKGEVTYKSSWWVETEKTQNVKLNNQLTFYSKHGDYLAIGSIISVIVMLGLLFKRNKI
jgi:apolipoprotein N-acyltransferase